MGLFDSVKKPPRSAPAVPDREELARIVSLMRTLTVLHDTGHGCAVIGALFGILSSYGITCNFIEQVLQRTLGSQIEDAVQTMHLKNMPDSSTKH